MQIWLKSLFMTPFCCVQAECESNFYVMLLALVGLHHSVRDISCKTSQICFCCFHWHLSWAFLCPLSVPISPWVLGAVGSPPLSSLVTFASIVEEEKEQEAALIRIREKPLALIQVTCLYLCVLALVDVWLDVRLVFAEGEITASGGLGVVWP